MSVTSKKPGIIICSIALLAFVAFAGLTAYSVNHLSSEISHTAVANVDGVPLAWRSSQLSDAISTQTEAEVKDGYIAYTTSVTNTSLTDSTVITHIASYINGEHKGFVPLSTNSLEYSYYPEATDSWTPAAVTAPGEGEEDFKLASEIYLGTGDSSNNTVYFRYLVAPSEAGNISDKVAFLTKTSDDIRLTISDNTVAYEPSNPDEVVAVSESSREIVDDESGNAAFAEPLGVTSETPVIATISLASIGNIALSPEVTAGSLIVLVVCLGIFVASLIAYLASRKKEEQQRRLF